jgi:hypothetical protein
MTPDYSAAHSMDTDWFAVDADGHVGYFDSGEAGAVPHDASPGNQDQGFRLREMLGARPRCEAVHDLAGRLRPDHDDAHARMTDGTPMLYFLRIADLAERHLSGEEPVLPLRGGPSPAAAADRADAALPFDAAALAPAVPGADPAETLRLQAEALGAVRDAVRTGQAFVMPAANAGLALRVPHGRRDFHDRLHAAGLCLGTPTRTRRSPRRRGWACTATTSSPRTGSPGRTDECWFPAGPSGSTTCRRRSVGWWDGCGSR